MTTISQFAEQYWPSNIHLSDKQKTILDVAFTNKTIVQGIRQSGKSLLLKILAFGRANFFQNQTVVIVAPNIMMSKHILDGIKEIYERMNPIVKCPVTGWYKDKIEFSNGSKIIVLPVNEVYLTGIQIDYLLMDEFALNDNSVKFNDFWSNILARTITNKSHNIFIASTRNSRSKKKNLFWNMWCKAVDGSNSYVPFTMGAKDVNHLSKAKLSEMKKYMGRTVYEKETTLRNKPENENYNIGQIKATKHVYGV